MSTKYDYDVIEDNGGSIGLYVFSASTDKCVYAHEYTDDNQLVKDLARLDAGEDVSTWDNNLLVDEEYPGIPHSSELPGWEIILNCKAGEGHKSYPERADTRGSEFLALLRGKQ